MINIFVIRIFKFILRVIIFLFSYILYIIQLLFIFLNFKSLAKKIFNYAAYLCSRSLGISYEISENFRDLFLKKGIHISNHDNPLDIFVAQYLFGLRTITTVDQHLKNFLPFFEVSLKNYGHYCFDYKNFYERKLAYLFLKKTCATYKNVLIYPSGSIYTSITQRFSKSVSKLSKINNLKVIAWKFYFDDKSNIKYQRKISSYILKRFYAKTITIKIKEVKTFNPSEYESTEDLHFELLRFYSNS